MTSTTSLSTPPVVLTHPHPSNLNSNNIQSSSTSSTSSTLDQLDAGYGTMNDQQEFDAYKKCFNPTTESPSTSQMLYDAMASGPLPSRSYQTNVVNKHQMQNMQPNWFQEEVEHERLAQKFLHANRNGPLVDQKMRRSTPNLLLDYNNQISLKTGAPSYSQSSYTNYMSPVVTSTAMARIQQLQTPHQPQSKVRVVNNNNNKNVSPLNKSRQANLYVSGKPPQPANTHQHHNRLVASASQGDLKNAHKLLQHQHQQTQYHHQLQPKSVGCSLPTQGSKAPISLNQKCSTCGHALGQGSAMFIEKLGLAFHLKCFRCSVCNIALGNGKEGTDVRVSGANRLHCNNCFSNDLGNRIEIHLVNNCHNNAFYSLNNLYNESEHFRSVDNSNQNYYRSSDEISNNIGNRITNYYDVLISSFSKKHVQLKSKLFDQHLVLPNYFATKTAPCPNGTPNTTTTTSTSNLRILKIQHF